jgi:CheY-like chemotaxis protein
MTNQCIAYIIDDDTINQFVFKRIIENKKFTKKIIPFLNGQLAIDFIKTHLKDHENLPDVIFIDINMPVMDGWEFMEAFQKLPLSKRTLIYLLSSSINPADLERAKKTNFVSDYIIKPIKNEQLDAIIQELEKKE